jgi:hypothetical protein
MKTNVGKKDTYIRLIIAAGLLIIGITDSIPGNWWIVTTAIAGILILTSATGYCALYSVLGINTCKRKKTSKK